MLMTQTLSYEEEAERAINPVKLANVEASRDCNGSQMAEMKVSETRDPSENFPACVSVCV